MEIKEAMKLARTIANLSETEKVSVMAVEAEIRAAKSTAPTSVKVAAKRGPKPKQVGAAADKPKRKYTKRAKTSAPAAETEAVA